MTVDAVHPERPSEWRGKPYGPLTDSAGPYVGDEGKSAWSVVSQTSSCPSGSPRLHYLSPGTLCSGDTTSPEDRSRICRGASTKRDKHRDAEHVRMRTVGYDSAGGDDVIPEACRVVTHDSVVFTRSESFHHAARASEAGAAGLSAKAEREPHSARVRKSPPGPYQVHRPGP